MTPQQHKLLGFIADYQAACGRAPSFGEMAAGIGLASKSGVHRALVALEHQGRTVRLRGRIREIHIVSESAPLREASDAALLAEVQRRGLAVLAC